MAQTVRRVREDAVREDIRDDDVFERRVDTRDRADGGVSMIQKFINAIALIIIGALAIRVILSLLGANRDNAFGNFIYSLTNPFVAPFQGLFNVDTTYGVGRFELETLVAMLVYGLVAWALIRLLDALRSDRTI